jgi:hypothetical protein
VKVKQRNILIKLTKRYEGNLGGEYEDKEQHLIIRR